MQNMDIYSVSRREYKAFVDEIKPECRDVQQVELTHYSMATKIFSKKTGKCLCSRVSYEQRVEGEERHPETYYIFEMPDDDERRAQIPKTKVILETPEQVQQFFDGLKKLREEFNSD